MRVADAQGRGGPHSDPPRPAAPRVYALDVLLPQERGTAPVVVDANGARSGVEAQQRLYGDDRVQRAVLEALAAAGDGTIVSLSQRSSMDLQDRFSAERLRRACGPGGGWYAAAEAYAPPGDPHARQRESVHEEPARELGIPLLRYEVGVLGDRPVLFGADGRVAGDYGDWDPRGVVWPYAFDQRTVPLRADLVCNPLAYALPTTDKLLLAALVPELLPATRPAGPWLARGEKLAEAAEWAAGEDHVVVKPAVGRRSFGVVVVPGARFAEVAGRLGVVARDAHRLDVLARVASIGMLWGQCGELSALVQPYVRPRLERNAGTGRWHAVVARATVLSDGWGVRCIDACKFVAPVPVGERAGRASMIFTHSGDPLVERLSAADEEAVNGCAVRFVAGLESAVDARLGHGDDAAALRAEADLLVGVFEEGSDLPVRGSAERLSGMPMGLDLVAAGYRWGRHG
ncbi:hypothetical protein ACFVFS_33225 [Kitasatospora sp. NPDC057692]|uniref:hypothetical protein n=1 Tax=Kitasatospora sp. NPDC057692 TaxID=3346215 RepID=UPI0036A1FF81